MSDVDNAEQGSIDFGTAAVVAHGVNRRQHRRQDRRDRR